MYSRFAFLVVCLCLCQCRQPDIKDTPTELTIKFVNELRPQLIGTWQLRLKYKDLLSVYSPMGIKGDTLLQDLAGLKFFPSTEKQSDARLLELEGTLTFRNKLYPIYARLYPHQNSGRLKGTMFIDFNFQENSALLHSPETSYLYEIGLAGENFSVETVVGEPTMIWRGLNRAIVFAELHKK